MSPYGSSHMTTTWECSRFILLKRLDFCMIDNLIDSLMTDPAFLIGILTPLSVDEKLLPTYLNWSTNFRGLPFHLEMVSSCLKRMNYVLSAFMSRPACSRPKRWVTTNKNKDEDNSPKNRTQNMSHLASSKKNQTYIFLQHLLTLLVRDFSHVLLRWFSG